MVDALMLSSDFRPQGCPFLCLPGELRNRIYDFCAELGAVRLPASHTFFGDLRHVCKLLYSEFTPIWLARTAVILQSADIERYLAVFYTDRRSRGIDAAGVPTGTTQASRVAGRIRIDIPLGATLDLSSFTNLRSIKLHFTIVRGSLTCRPLEIASEVLRTIVASSCSDRFQQIVERILFRYSLTPEIVLKLRKGLTFGNLPDVVCERKLRQWLIRQGFPSLFDLDIVVESSKGVLRSPGYYRHRYRHAGGHTHMHPFDEPDDNNLGQIDLTTKLSQLIVSRN